MIPSKKVEFSIRIRIGWRWWTCVVKHVSIWLGLFLKWATKLFYSTSLKLVGWFQLIYNPRKWIDSEKWDHSRKRSQLTFSKHIKNLSKDLSLGLFQHTELEHIPSNLYQQARKGFLSWLAIYGGVRYRGLLQLSWSPTLQNSMQRKMCNKHFAAHDKGLEQDGPLPIINVRSHTIYTTHW